LFPQSPDSNEWKDFNAELIVAELDATLREFNGARDRVYPTGSSMGGGGVYHLASAYPDRFAAFVVSCGSPFVPQWRLEQLGEPEVDRSASAFLRVAQKMPESPVWIFHGTADTTVAFSEAQEIVSALEAVGREPRFTTYPGKGHRDGCGLAYLEEKLWSWLLAIKGPPE
jgi:predicted peptidase